MKKIIFSEANSAFKRHWWKFFILDSLFLAAAFIFFIYARAKIKSYFTLISTYAAQVSAVETAIAENSAAGMGQMQELLSILGPIAKQMSFFTFFIVPLVIFALWCLFQAPSYTLIARNKVFSLTHYIRFIVFTAPFYILGLFLLNEIFNIAYAKMFSAFKDPFFYMLLVLLFVLSYTLQACYAFTLNQKYKDIVKSALCVLKKPHRMIPSFVLYAFFWFLIVINMVNFYLKWVGGSAYSIAFAALPVLGILLLMAWARALFTLKAMKCE